MNISPNRFFTSLRRLFLVTLTMTFTNFYFIKKVNAEYNLSSGLLIESSGDSVIERLNIMLESAADSKSHESRIYQFSLDGVTIPIHVSGKNKKYVFKLYDPNSESRDDSCLVFSINPVDAVGFVDEIDTHNNPCLEGVKSKGNFILKLVDHISKSIGLESTELIDASEVMCEASDENSSLTMIHMMKTGKGWYESKGYKTRNGNQTTYDLAKHKLRSTNVFDMWKKIQEFYKKEKTHIQIYSDEIELLRSNLANESGVPVPIAREINIYGYYSELERHYRYKDPTKIDLFALRIKEIYEKIKFLEYLNSLNDLIKNIKSLFETYKKKNKTNELSEFLNWLWKNKCEHYNSVLEVFFPSSKKASELFSSWMKDYELFAPVSSLKKTYTYPESVKKMCENKNQDLSPEEKIIKELSDILSSDRLSK